MNGFMKYDHGTLASAFFEHTRRNDADFRRKTFELRTAMYKSTYKKDFSWSEHTLKPNNHQVEPRFTLIPKLNEDEFKQLYTPKIIHRKLGDNKGIEPPLDYSNNVPSELQCQNKMVKDCEECAISLYQESYKNWMPSQVHRKEETLEEWTQKWKNEFHNVRDADALVQDLADRIINSQKTILNRKRIRNV